MTQRDKFMLIDRLMRRLPELTYPETFMIVSAVENVEHPNTAFPSIYGTHGTNALRSGLRKIKNLPQEP
jgi:hypothetical protein